MRKGLKWSVEGPAAGLAGIFANAIYYMSYELTYYML